MASLHAFAQIVMFHVQTYHTLQDMRVVFLDGTVLDTADPASRESFLKVSFSLLALWGSCACSDACCLSCVDWPAGHVTIRHAPLKEMTLTSSRGTHDKCDHYQAYMFGGFATIC